MWARTGTPLLLLAGAASLVLIILLLVVHELWLIPLLVLALSLLGLFLIFFRDPERAPGQGIVAAADGRVLSITPEDEGRRVRIATFMNVTNVHVNRVPISGYLVRVEDRGGPKRPAFSPDASGNSQKRYLFGTPLGLVEVVQITGMVARRCVAWKGSGSPCRKGERLGMIVLGSRVDVVLPASRVRPTVTVGQPVRAGRDTLAEVRA